MHHTIIKIIADHYDTATGLNMYANAVFDRHKENVADPAIFHIFISIIIVGKRLQSDVLYGII